MNIIYYFITDGITKQDASMEFCPTLEMIGYYSTMALQGSRFCLFYNSILGIHEEEIPIYIASIIAFLEVINIKLDKLKEDSQKALKLAGDQVNQILCWGGLTSELKICDRCVK